MSTVDRAGPYSEISMCLYHMTGRACPVLPTGTSVSGQENLAIRTIQPGYRDESGMNFSQQDGSSCFVCCISHTINIPLNCSDKARVAKAMIGEKVIILSSFVSRISHQNSFPGSSAFPHLRNRAEGDFSFELKAKRSL